MDNDSLCKRKNLFLRDRKARRFLLSKNLEKCLTEEKNFKSGDFKGNNLKNESILSAVSVRYFSSQNFKDKIEARKWMEKDNFA